MAITTSKKSLESLYKAVSAQVKINGTVLSKDFEIFRISTFKEINKLSRAKIQILGGDHTKNIFTESENAVFDSGNEIEIKFAYEQKPVLVFEGIILKHSISVNEGYMRKKTKSQIVIECVDKAIFLKNSLTTKVFKDKSDQQIITNLINNVEGLTSSIDQTSYVHPVFPKYNIDDWSFILKRAKYNGLLVLNSNNKLTIKDPTVETITPEVMLTNGGGTLSFEAHLDSENQFNKIQLESRDSFNEEVFTKSGTEPNQLVTNLKDQSKIISKNSSPEKVNINFAQDVDANELKVLADSITKISRLQRISGKAKFKGVLEIDLDSVVALSGFGNRFDGNVYVSGVSHEIDEGRIFTEIKFGLSQDFFNPQNIFDNDEHVNSINGLQVGKVVQIHNDPQNQYRIKVEIPTLNDLGGGIWAKLMHPYTGDGDGGSFFIPEVGSQVVISFVGNDSRHHVVLGSLYTDAFRPAKSISESNNLKSIKTKSNLRIQFDDIQKEIKISTPAGNEINLNESMSDITIKDMNSNMIKTSPQGIELKSLGSVKIDALGSISLNGVMGISASSVANISLSGFNISNSAKANFSAKATSGLDLNSAGIAALKGSIVQIN